MKNQFKDEKGYGKSKCALKLDKLIELELWMCLWKRDMQRQMDGLKGSIENG